MVGSEDVVGSEDTTLGMRSTRTCSTRGLDVGHDSFICVTRFVHICKVIYSYV